MASLLFIWDGVQDLQGLSLIRPVQLFTSPLSLDARAGLLELPDSHLTGHITSPRPIIASCEWAGAARTSCPVPQERYRPGPRGKRQGRKQKERYRGSARHGATFSAPSTESSRGRHGPRVGQWAEASREFLDGRLQADEPTDLLECSMSRARVATWLTGWQRQRRKMEAFVAC